MRRGLLVLLLCGLAACAGVTGLDDYTVARVEGRDGTPAPAPIDGRGDPGTPPPPGPDAALEISIEGAARAMVMLPFTQRFVALGGAEPYTFSLAAGTLPPGLELSAAGELAGTPEEAATTTLTVAATDTGGRTGRLAYPLTIAPPHTFSIDDADDVVLATLAGAKANEVASFVFTIGMGKVVGSTDATKPALATGNFQPGSVVTLVNHGGIHGLGGAGGAGGTLTTGEPGKAGGPALALAFPLRLDNTTGTIFGGGGGGGSTSIGWGCGGGGGQGAHASAGGDMNRDGQPGGPGGPGAGGARDGMRGGAGGAWGEPGSDGSSNSATTGGKGGAAGAAIVTNGEAIEWLGGNAPDWVKGEVTP